MSCQKIVFNLHSAYTRLPATELLNFNFNVTDAREENLGLAQAIFDARPDVISIIDHKPHPILFLTALIPMYTQAKLKLPKFVFHVFGDFTLYYPSWERLQLLLKGAPVQFLVASPRQKLLLDRMLQGSEAIVCPFPVNAEEFFPSPQLRRDQRKAWGLMEHDFAFVFTGRLSRQKRIKTMLSTFHEAFADDPRAHLFIYGYADNIGDPFMSWHDSEGEYFRSFYRTYRELPPEVQGRVHFMGQVPNRDLLPVYQAADAFLNLSVHNDEDYGMSVAEAEFSGLPCIITDWGGLAGFFHPELPQATCLIPVAIGKRSKVIRREDVLRALRSAKDTFAQVDRPTLASLAQKKFGVDATFGVLEKLFAEPFPTFEKFSPLLLRAAQAALNQPYRPPYRTRNNQINNLYREIYSAYVRPR